MAAPCPEEPSPIDAVLHAMRRMEALRTDTGRRRVQLIEECRRTVGAISVALCRVSHTGALSIVHLAGAMPDADTAAQIAACAAKRSRQSFSMLRRGETGDLVLAGRGAEVVGAVLPRDTEAWVEHVVAFAAERLVRPAVSPDEAPPSPLGSLVLPPDMVVGTSAAMRELLRQMSATVPSGIDVLLSGETGTGKELLARIVHASGPTRGGSFVAINCAAIPAELLEAELFGVERRVATGVDPRIGLFVEADRGSIFLDEIAEMPERLQAKLLRVIQEREVLAVGATKPRRISVRIISASNQDLPALVAEGRFRADLYYRLRGLEFHLPPLRDRAEDIPALALEFATRVADEYRKSIAGISSTAIELLQQHPWPGNIRELQTEVRRAVLLCPHGESLEREHFTGLVPQQQQPRKSVDAIAPIAGDPSVVLLRERLAAIERVEIESAMRATGGNRSHAARLLGITRNGLAHKLQRLGLPPKRFRMGAK